MMEPSSSALGLGQQWSKICRSSIPLQTALTARGGNVLDAPAQKVVLGGLLSPSDPTKMNLLHLCQEQQQITELSEYTEWKKNKETKKSNLFQYKQERCNLHLCYCIIYGIKGSHMTEIIFHVYSIV